MSQQNAKPLSGYEVLLCVTGGIAAYKSADLASKLVQAGCGVTVAMTDAGMRFVTPLTFQSLTHRPVYSSMWTHSQDFRAQHIALTEQADLMVIAPATADVLAKMACGIADDLVTTMALSAWEACPILLAPAMNSRMWAHPSVQENLQKLRGWGVDTVGPAEGNLACRTVGMGRMAEPAEILQAIQAKLVGRPAKKTVRP